MRLINWRITLAGMVQPASKLSQVGVGGCIAVARKGAPCSPYKSTRTSRTRWANSRRPFVPFSSMRHPRPFPVLCRPHTSITTLRPIMPTLQRRCRCHIIPYQGMFRNNTPFESAITPRVGPLARLRADGSRRWLFRSSDLTSWRGNPQLEGDEEEVSSRGRAKACVPSWGIRPVHTTYCEVAPCFQRLPGASPLSSVSSASPHSRNAGCDARAAKGHLNCISRMGGIPSGSSGSARNARDGSSWTRGRIRSHG